MSSDDPRHAEIGPRPPGARGSGPSSAYGGGGLDGGTTWQGALFTGQPRTARRLPHRTSLAIVAIGLAVTAALTVTAQLSYVRNERRLTSLQANLTGSLVGTVPTDLEGSLGRVVGLAAESSDPVTTFEQAIASSMAPKGGFASASLALVSTGQTTVLDHIGTQPLHPLDSPASAALFERAAATTSLITTRAVGKHVQKLGYLLSAVGPGGTYVVAAAQQLPLDEQLHVAPSSPIADLNIAVYFGDSTSPKALLASDVSTLPLGGIVSKSTVKFGTSVLTLVISPRGSLAGPWSEFLPWGILGVGVLMTLMFAGLTERLVRRRVGAEFLASANRLLYQQQRGVATTLQHALLPKALPSIPGVELAASYIPSAVGAEIGGDWYNVILADTGRLVFVVGDVSGHGVDAASVMASLRYTVRTLARLGLEPGEILDRADAEIDVTVDGHFATVLVGSIDLDADVMTMASAGHPPAILVRPGESRFCEAALGPPLGVGGGPYGVSTVPFPKGWTLLAYTDGLVERRGRGIDEGLTALATAGSEGPRAAATLVDWVVGALTDGRNDDDIAVLAIRR